MTETGSGWITALTDPVSGNPCWLATITRVEVLAAFYLRVRTGTLLLSQAQRAEQIFRHELSTHYRRLPFAATVLNQAMRLVAQYPLRAYDAVQLASALQLRRERVVDGESVPTLISADQNLNQAAQAEGLPTDDPNRHP